MAKKFQKSKDPKVQAAASSKTRRYLFDIMWRAHEVLGETLTRPDIEKLDDENLTVIGMVLDRMHWRIRELIGVKDPRKVTKKKPAAAKKKTPRPKARRKG